jgi:all-trans-retinol 13,14-reductase
MGRLTTAALLSDLGWTVCVLEQHYTAGGYTHSYERQGYEWDVGVHYIGDVGAMTRTRRMFDYLTDGQLRWAPMDDEYDRFYVGDKVFSAVAGKTEFRDNLVRQFPAEEQAIDRYMGLLSQVGGALSMFGMARVLKPWQKIIATPYLKWKTPKTDGRPAPDRGHLRPVGRHGVATQAVGFHGARDDRASLSLWWLLPGRRQLEDR